MEEGKYKHIQTRKDTHAGTHATLTHKAVRKEKEEVCKHTQTHGHEHGTHAHT